MHYFIIFFITAIVLIWQYAIYHNNKGRISLFRDIFPDNQEKFQLAQDDTFCEILNLHKNIILDEIISSLNKYLRNNKNSVSDFHLMKDIVDRNCDAREEEIQTQIPFPLLLGLAGTMLGILIGVAFFVFWGGGLESLVSTENNSGLKGIESLLSGVALAMASSIAGIILTIHGSNLAKEAKLIGERNKNTFLSWIQAELMPNLTSDTSSALERMTRNLSSFNNKFAENTINLGDTLTIVNDSYQKQAEMMRAINRLKIGDIASANIEVYDKLKNSTNEIGVFAQYLQSANEYLSTIQELNRKLDDYEKRTQVIENAGHFFSKNEKWLAENFDIANLEVKSAINRLKDVTSESLNKLQESLNGQILTFDKIMKDQQGNLQESLNNNNRMISEAFERNNNNFEKAILSQQGALQEKLQETSKLIEELKNLTHIKEGIKEFKEATNRQNGKLEDLTKEIRAFAQIKTEGGTIKQIISLPKWITVFLTVGSSLLIISCLFYISPILIELIDKLIKWIL